MNVDDKDRRDQLECDGLMMDFNKGKEVALETEDRHSSASVRSRPSWVGPTNGQDRAIGSTVGIFNKEKEIRDDAEDHVKAIIFQERRRGHDD